MGKAFCATAVATVTRGRERDPATVAALTNIVQAVAQKRDAARVPVAERTPAAMCDPISVMAAPTAAATRPG